MKKIVKNHPKLHKNQIKMDKKVKKLEKKLISRKNVEKQYVKIKLNYVKRR